MFWHKLSIFLKKRNRQNIQIILLLAKHYGFTEEGSSTSSSTTTLRIVWAIAEQGREVKRRIPVADTTWQASATGNFVVLFNFYSFLQ